MENISNRDRKIIEKAKGLRDADIKIYLNVSRFLWILATALIIFGVIDYLENSAEKALFFGVILYVMGVGGMQYYKTMSALKKVAEKHGE